MPCHGLGFRTAVENNPLHRNYQSPRPWLTLQDLVNGCFRSLV
jgi:hypothetical protein